MRKIHVVFDGPPAPESGRFVEVEEDGRSINFGEWKQREDGYWVLEFYYPSEVPAALPYSPADVFVVECPECGGRGLDTNDEDFCPRCHGTGSLRMREVKP